MYLDYGKEAQYNKDMQCSNKYLLLYNIQYTPNLSRLEILQLIHKILSFKEYKLLGQINISDPLCDLILKLMALVTLLKPGKIILNQNLYLQVRQLFFTK